MGKPGSLPSPGRACSHLAAGSPLPALPHDLPHAGRVPCGAAPPAPFFSRC